MPGRRQLDDLPELLTVDELAQVLRVGRSMAYEIARRHRVPGLGRVVRVPRAVVERMIRGEAEDRSPLRAVL